jgi:hypothetical protein
VQYAVKQREREGEKKGREGEKEKMNRTFL